MISACKRSNEPKEFFLYYLRKFKGVKGILGPISGAFPFVSRFLGLENRRIVPPLDYDILIIYALLLAMMVLVIFSFRYLDYFRKRGWLSAGVVVLFFVSACIAAFKYADWQEKAIRCGQVQPEGRDPVTICLIIGLEKSEDAKQNYPHDSPTRMLQKRGWTKEQVRYLWTGESIEKARRRVMGYYLAIPLLLVGMAGVMGLRECIDQEMGR